MVTLRCQDCGRIVTMTQDKYDSYSEWDCAECNGDLVIKDSEDDTYEEDEEENEYDCNLCQEDITKKEIGFLDEDLNFSLCKSCQRKIAGKTEPQIIYKEKIVEKPIIKYVDKDGQEVVKQQSNNTFNSVF